MIQGTRGPFSSQFDAITYQKTLGNSNYNALEVNLRHKHGPLEVLGAIRTANLSTFHRAWPSR